MRVKMNYVLGGGASPSTEREYDFDGFTAQALLDCAERCRAIMAAASEQIAAELDAHELWSPDRTPSWAVAPTADARGHAAALRGNMLDLLDDVLDQDILAEAGEVA
jgi:hypothetical protein